MRIGLLCALAFGTVLAFPGRTQIKIVAPQDGTIVRPGQSVNVTVEASKDLRGIALLGTYPLGFEGPLEKPPYKFKIAIPAVIEPGPQMITAYGITPDSQTKEDHIAIKVERADSPLELSAAPQVMNLDAGEWKHLEISGKFADRSTIQLTNSTLNRFSSDQPRVASVDGYGKVTGRAPGSAKIRIRNGTSQTEVQVIVVNAR